MPKEPILESYQGLPVVSAKRMAELDALAQTRYGLPGLGLMENAGRLVAEETAAFLERSGKALAGARIVALCGRGSNGGDGLVAARCLKQKGADAAAFLCPPKEEASGGYPGAVRVNLDRARAEGVRVFPAQKGEDLSRELGQADVVLDALLGTGSSGKPAGAVRQMIQAATRSKKPVLAVDIPSGIHPDTGYHSGVFIIAAETLTVGLPKRGLLAPHARKNVGELKVLDIGYPKELVASAFPAP